MLVVTHQFTQTSHNVHYIIISFISGEDNFLALIFLPLFVLFYCYEVILFWKIICTYFLQACTDITLIFGTFYQFSHYLVYEVATLIEVNFTLALTFSSNLSATPPFQFRLKTLLLTDDWRIFVRISITVIKNQGLSNLITIKGNYLLYMPIWIYWCWYIAFYTNLEYSKYQKFFLYLVIKAV